MTMIASLVVEFEHEAQTTRRLLERLPSEKLDWRPHEKSFTARGLASHIVDCVGWADPIFSRDEINVDPATFKSYLAASVPELLRTFDAKVAAGNEALAGVADADLMQPWPFKIMSMGVL